MESKLQTKIIKFLKDRGAYVIKTRVQPGTPVGCPDIIFLYEGAWGAIEVKASVRAPYRNGQEATLKHFESWTSFVYMAHPDNWETIKAELQHRFF